MIRAAIVGLVAALCVVFVASSSANLTGSTFEGNDGNMIVDTAGQTDWANVAGLQTLIDNPTGPTDNSFTQGTMEDDPNVTIDAGSIPPNKNDLTRAYLANEEVGDNSFLYLAWERLVNIGSASIDFELNQNATDGWTGSTTGPVTINRTEGDLLITYDFSGSGTPTIGMLKWLTDNGTNSDSDCSKSGQTLPCWGNQVTFDPSVAEAAVNAGTIDETQTGGSLTAGLFGEAAVNFSSALVAAGFSPDTCEQFGSVFVKSRASGSGFDAELKDFIAPVPIHVSNCASPSIATTLSKSTGSIGDTVTDSSTLSGATSDAGGTVTYTVYSDSQCTQQFADAGTVDVTNGVVPDSNGVQFTTPGTYYWQASYSGDNHNNAATSACADEQLVIKNQPSISTLLSASAGMTGDTVHDSATLTGATASAGGTVTYTAYSNSTCTTKFADGGTVSVTNGSVPDSNGVRFTTPGTYYWQASYTGDSHNESAISPCLAEKLVIAPQIDLAITKVGTPNPVNVNNQVTWTIVVTNNGPDTATGVVVSDPVPPSNTFVSVSTTKGTCTGGAVVTCSLGTMAAGQKVTITLVTIPTVTGNDVNTVVVVGNEHETNTANNKASATVVVNKPFTPPVVYCTKVVVKPKQLYVGRKSHLKLKLTAHGKAVKGVKVRIKGPKIKILTKKSNRKGVIKRQLKPKKAGIVTFTPVKTKSCKNPRVGITGIFTPPVTG